MYFIDGIIFIIKSIIHIIRYFFIGLYTVITFIPYYFIVGIKFILKKDKTKKVNSKENKKISLIIISLTIIVYLICIFFLSRWYVQTLKVNYLSKDIINSTTIIEEEDKSNINSDDNTGNTNIDNNSDGSGNTDNKTVYYPNDYWDYLSVPFINVNFNELLQKNSDTVGWIKIDGTKVNYPIVQTSDNDYYLNHSFDKKNNIGGWIFADYRVDFKNFGRNTIIYGHNMNNKTMFGSVPNMQYNSYLNNSSNYYIKISTPISNSNWKVFSIYTIEPETYYLKTNFKSEPFENFINTIKGRSIYNFGIDVTSEDKILTLSTCDNIGTKRVVVHAKMVNISYK